MISGAHQRQEGESESSGKPAAFISGSTEHEERDEEDEADDHGEGVVRHPPGLDARPRRAPRPAARSAAPFGMPSMIAHVAHLPEQPGEAEGRPDEDRVVELVEVPLVQQEQVDGRGSAAASRAGRPGATM